MPDSLSGKIDKYKSASVEVKSSIEKPPKNLDEFLVQLESRIVSKLRTTNAFEKVFAATASETPAELQITMTVTRIRDVDNLDRALFGMFSGQASTQAAVQWRDQATGQVIGTALIEGKSSNGTILSGTTSQAVDRVADEVVRIVMQGRQ